MATNKTPPTLDEFISEFSSFSKQKDRGITIISSAWLDDALTQLLQKYLQRDSKMVAELLRPENALGSFAVKAKICYLLGLIEDSAYRDIENIRLIRNKFAHSRNNLSFSDNSIKDRLKNMNGLYAFEIGSGPKVRSQRMRFLISSYYLFYYLISCTKYYRKKNVKESNGYQMWIRRLAKHQTLTTINTKLKAFD